jgi:hypothetical protein
VKLNLISVKTFQSSSLIFGCEGENYKHCADIFKTYKFFKKQKRIRHKTIIHRPMLWILEDFYYICCEFQAGRTRVIYFVFSRFFVLVIKTQNISP